MRFISLFYDFARDGSYLASIDRAALDQQRWKGTMGSSRFSMKTLLDFGRRDSSPQRRIPSQAKRASGKLTNRITPSVEDPATNRSQSSAAELNPSHRGMFDFHLPGKELPVSIFGNFLITFDCKCEGELFSDILVIGHECRVHQGITTHNHSIYLEALRHEWKR